MISNFHHLWRVPSAVDIDDQSTPFVLSLPCTILFSELPRHNANLIQYQYQGFERETLHELCVISPHFLCTLQSIVPLGLRRFDCTMLSYYKVDPTWAPSAINYINVLVAMMCVP